MTLKKLRKILRCFNGINPASRLIFQVDNRIVETEPLEFLGLGVVGADLKLQIYDAIYPTLGSITTAVDDIVNQYAERAVGPTVESGNVGIVYCTLPRNIMVTWILDDNPMYTGKCNVFGQCLEYSIIFPVREQEILMETKDS